MTGGVQVHRGGKSSGGPVVCAAHPSEDFGPATAELLGIVARAQTVCVNAHGRPLEQMVDAVEAERVRLGLPPWIFWGMSGGGFLAQLYAKRHPKALAGIVVESACPCFKARVEDSSCVLSPSNAAWVGPLKEAGLAGVDPGSGPTEWMEMQGGWNVLRRVKGPAVMVVPGKLDDGMRAAMPALLAFDSRPWLSSVKTPALVIAGSDDPVAPLHHVKKVHEALGDRSTWLVVKGGGHVPTTLRHQDVISGYQAFLAKHQLVKA